VDAEESSVRAFLDGIPSEIRRRDGQRLLELLGRVTGEPARLWGTIVGFGHHHYRYASGREGDTAAVGFSPRKAQSVLYLTGGVEQYDDLLAALGPHQTGKACLYLKRVDQVDAPVLRQIVDRSYRAATPG